MSKSLDLFTVRKSLDAICTVPERIISVYSLEKHVWADSNAPDTRRQRKPELKTIEELQIDPVRPFLTDVLRHLAAPWDRGRKDDPVGQGYWIQAEFGSGKSHLLCFLSALALGNKAAWEMVREKESKSGRGKRESLYRFFEEGLEAKSAKGRKGILVVVRTLVGAGSGMVGGGEKGRPLAEYVLDAIKDQLQVETGKNLSLYPAELLADKFLSKDVARYRTDLKKFLRDPRFFSEDEFEDVDAFLRDIRENRSPEYKRSCGNKLWRFYTEFLEQRPIIAAESEEVLQNAVEVVLAEGYSGVLLVLDEVSLFMKNRDEDQRVEDEKTLVVLSNRLGKVANLPVWTVCAAQQAIESRMGVKNIIADDRLKLVKLLEKESDYYQIVLARVREIVDPGAIAPYYLHYKKRFSWPASLTEKEFGEFFPFHKPALEVLRFLTYELTTTRSAIHFMHQTLKFQVKRNGRELIRLWELFDEAVRYEEDPSGVHAGLVAIKTKKEDEYRAYEACRRQVDAATRGFLKVHRDKAVKVLQTLFLHHVGKVALQGLTGEDLANAVLVERDDESTVEENIEHYESLATNLKKELRQVAELTGEDGRPRYRFEPVVTGVDPREEFRRTRDEVEGNEALLREAWNHLLALDEWKVRTRQMTLDLSSGVRSLFADVSPWIAPWEDRDRARAGDQKLGVLWLGRQIQGLFSLREIAESGGGGLKLPSLDTADSDLDFAFVISSRPMKGEALSALAAHLQDPRILLWAPAELTKDERQRLVDFAAYRKLVEDWQGKDTEDAGAVISWVSNTLQSGMGAIQKVVTDSYARGRVAARGHSQIDFVVAGKLEAIAAPLVDRVLKACYESRDVRFDPPYVFKAEEAVKVINGLVRTGEIPKGAKPNQNISAAQNFAPGLGLVKKGAERVLDVSANRFVADIWSFLDGKLSSAGQTMKLDTLYKNFMGVGGPKDYGLTRRMVQIYVLCLVRQGRVRVAVGAKSGLAIEHIDHSNLAEVDFTSAVLAAMTEVEKLTAPEAWEVLRPYAEKLLGRPLAASEDGAAVAGYRSELKSHFAEQKERSARRAEEARNLFGALGATNPYEKEVSQVERLFAAELTPGDDVALALHALKEAFGYEAFDRDSADPREVDDLANRLEECRRVDRFLAHERDLRAATAYARLLLPSDPGVAEVRKHQKKLADKLRDPRPWLDSEVKLKTELIGSTPPASGESGTLRRLVLEYTTVYAHLHDAALAAVTESGKKRDALLAAGELRGLADLEQLEALRPMEASLLAVELASDRRAELQCPDTSRASIDADLMVGPFHRCGLALEDLASVRVSAGDMEAEARARIDGLVRRKLQVFFSPVVRDLLTKSPKDLPASHSAAIERILGCATVDELRAFLIPAVLADSGLVGALARCLREVTVRHVALSSFRPSLTMVEEDQIHVIAAEFRRFLEAELKAAATDSGGTPVLQLE